jgi:hypothetical protein
MNSTKRPRVLIVVCGGIAEYVYDDGVEVELFDFDNYRACPEDTDPVPAHFADLAATFNAPVEGVNA